MQAVLLLLPLTSLRGTFSVVSEASYEARINLVRTFERFDLQIGLWVGSSIVLAIISTTACHLISVYAQGSGVPEVKTILSGINFYKYLSLGTLVAKFIGLVTIQGAGFFVGFQGPIVHCSAIVADNVMKLKIFREFHDVRIFFTSRAIF